MLFSARELSTGLILFAPRVGGALLVFLGFWLAGALVGPMLRGLARRTAGEHAELVELAAQASRIALRVIGTICALGTLGIDISALVAGLGLTGFALGFALKDALSNILAGAMILFYRPFRKGDHIATAGLEGTVTAIDLRYTTLLKGEQRILIPNSTLLTNAVVVGALPVAEMGAQGENAK